MVAEAQPVGTFAAPLNIRQVLEILRDAFPSSHFTRTDDELVCHITKPLVGGSFSPILWRVTAIPHKAAGLELKAVDFKLEFARGEGTNPLDWDVEDKITVTTVEDLIGWVSWISGTEKIGGGPYNETGIPGRVLMPNLTRLCWEAPLSSFHIVCPKPFITLRLMFAEYFENNTLYRIHILRPGDIEKSWALFYSVSLSTPQPHPLLFVSEGFKRDVEKAALELQAMWKAAPRDSTAYKVLRAIYRRLQKDPAPTHFVVPQEVHQWVCDCLKDTTFEHKARKILVKGNITVRSSLLLAKNEVQVVGDNFSHTLVV